MASLTITFGFAIVFACLDLLETATANIHASDSGLFAWLMSVAFVAAVMIAFGLTQLLLVSYVRALDANAAAGHAVAGRRFLHRLTKATQLAAAVAFLAGAVVQLVAFSGYLGGDVGWVHSK